MKLTLGSLTQAVEKRKQALESENFWPRFLDHDPTLWTQDEAQHEEIRHRLGWVDLLPKMKEHLPALTRLSQDVAQEGYRHVVLLGMGGSSLCPDVLQTTFGSTDSHPTLLVLDSTDPEKIAEIEQLIDPQKTLFIVASKSGGTVEVQSLFRHFHQTTSDGKHYVAITDEGTVLEKQAAEFKFRAVFINPSDIGGRYSALSLFGLVPAALIGMDLERWIAQAEKYVQNPKPAIELGVIMGEAARAGRDKLTLLVNPELSALGAWIEQLVAESTGKEGKGIVPIDLEPLDADVSYGSDRLFVHIQTKDSKHPALEELTSNVSGLGHPTVTRQLEDLYDLGGEFFHWELATAVAGAVLQINPFDQPNVQESKNLTNLILKEFETRGKLEIEPAAVENELRAFMRSVDDDDYLALLAYLPQNDRTEQKLQEIRKTLLLGTDCATTLGFGPRFLHSTGQLHKGGANNGVFIQITSEKSTDYPVPDASYSFKTLQQAQADGDLRALRKHRKRAIRLHIDPEASTDLTTLHQWFKRIFSE